jgi:hypothetical protein
MGHLLLLSWLQKITYYLVVYHSQECLWWVGIFSKDNYDIRNEQKVKD